MSLRLISLSSLSWYFWNGWNPCRDCKKEKSCQCLYSFFINLVLTGITFGYIESRNRFFLTCYIYIIQCVLNIGYIDCACTYIILLGIGLTLAGCKHGVLCFVWVTRNHDRVHVFPLKPTDLRIKFTEYIILYTKGVFCCFDSPFSFQSTPIYKVAIKFIVCWDVSLTVDWSLYWLQWWAKYKPSWTYSGLKNYRIWPACNIPLIHQTKLLVFSHTWLINNTSRGKS